MATYNGQTFLAEQITSVCNDLRENDELIISDNGSTDETLTIIKQFNDPRIRLVACSELGVNLNFENAVKHAVNDIIFFCDQDDIWYSGKRDKCVNNLKNNDLIMHNADVHNNANLSYSKLHDCEADLEYRTTILSNKFTGCCMAGKKEFISSCLPFPILYPYFDQWIAVNAIAKRKKYTFLNECLIMHRRHAANNSSLLSRSNQSLREKISQRLFLVLLIFKLRMTKL